MSDTIYADETLVDIANSMYAISNELNSAKMKFEQAMALLNEHYESAEALSRFSELSELFTERIETLARIYDKYSDYIWYVLATLLETDNELAAKVYKRMQESLAGER